MSPLGCDIGTYHQLNKRFFTLRSRAAHLAKVKKKEAIKQINLNLYKAQS